MHDTQSSPDVNIYRHRHGFSVYYLTARAAIFQAQLRTRHTQETWPAIDELVRLMRAAGIVISVTRADDVAIN